MSTTGLTRIFAAGPLALLFCIAPFLAIAQIEDDLDDLMGGFDDEAEFETAKDEKGDSRWPSWIPEGVDLSGSISIGAVYGLLNHSVPHGDVPGRSTSYGNLTRLDLDGFLQLDVELPADWKFRGEARGWYDFAYRIRGRGNYGSAVLDVYEWNVDTGEIYVTGPLHKQLDLTIGRKVVNWGRSDTLRVVDVVNPLDNKEPGLVDIQDLRRPRAMIKFDASLGPWSAQFLVIPENRFDRLPPRGSDFFPPMAPSAPSDGRARFAGTPGLAAKVDGRFTGWDFSLYGAYVDESSRVLDRVGPTELRAKANRFGLVGAAGNFASGPWLFKLEMAWLTGIRTLHIRPPDPFPGTDDKDRFDTMLGVEYYGPDGLTIALEIVNRHLLNESKSRQIIQLTQQSQFESALRISRPFFRERLNLTALAVGFGERLQGGGLVRFSGDFELTDSWSIEGGLLLFIGGPAQGFGAFESNDRLYAELEYSF